MLIGFCILTQTLSTPYDHNPVQGCLDTLILLGDPQQLMYPGAGGPEIRVGWGDVTGLTVSWTLKSGLGCGQRMRM